MTRQLLLLLSLLFPASSVAQASVANHEPCPVFVVDPDPNDPVYGHCSSRGGWESVLNF